MTIPQTRLTRRAFFTAPFGSAAPNPTHDPASGGLFRQYTPTPHLDAAHWGFSIGGSVAHPLVWSYADLLAYPQVEIPCTMLCASNPPGGERIGHAVWRGVPLRALLDEINFRSGAAYARLEAADGHVTGIPLQQLRGALLAFALDGEALPPEQGYPARLVVPGLYDHKSPRWIERIELTGSPSIGAWEARGWSADGVIQPTSGFLSPRRTERTARTFGLHGYAYAGEQPIASVEVSVDDGDWMPVPFSPNPPNMWARWQVAWQAPSDGDFVARVRATDSIGRVQPPDAIHVVVLHVGAQPT